MAKEKTNAKFNMQAEAPHSFKDKNLGKLMSYLEKTTTAIAGLKGNGHSEQAVIALVRAQQLTTKADKVFAAKKKANGKDTMQMIAAEVSAAKKFLKVHFADVGTKGQKNIVGALKSVMNSVKLAL